PPGGGFVRRDDLLGEFEDVGHHPLVDEREKVLFRFDVVVERPFAQSNRVAQLGGTGRVVAALREQPRRGVDDAAPARLPTRVSLHAHAHAFRPLTPWSDPCRAPGAEVADRGPSIRRQPGTGPADAWSKESTLSRVRANRVRQPALAENAHKGCAGC